MENREEQSLVQESNSYEKIAYFSKLKDDLIYFWLFYFYF